MQQASLGRGALLEELHIPVEATQALVHVRDYTKGHPTIEANNHPIRHGAVVGIHNGIILNDEEIFARYGFERAEPDMTVDSEAIFALAEHAEGRPEALEELLGAMATGWFDERRPETLFLARAVGRPLWIGTAAARSLLRLHARRARGARAVHCGITLRKREVDEGTLLRVEEGHVATASASSRIAPTSRRRSFPPCARRTRARPACSGSPRSPCASV